MRNRALLGLVLLALLACQGCQAGLLDIFRISPILECVEIKDGWIIAHFGFENLEGILLWIVRGILNFIDGWNADPPEYFPFPLIIPGRPGRTGFYPNTHFTVKFPIDRKVTWWLMFRKAEAHKNSPRCPSHDTKPPTITCPSEVVANTAPGRNVANVSFTVSVSDDSGSFTILNDYNDLNTPEFVDEFPIGPTQVKFVAQDSSANKAECTVTVVVFDKEPPLLTCPASRTVPTGNSDRAYVQDFVAEAVDNSGSVTITNDYPYSPGTADASGAYRLGDTIVKWTATDPSENKAVCSSTVTVIDDYPPWFVNGCPASYTFNNDPGQATARRTIEVQTSDNAPGYIVVTNSLKEDSEDPQKVTYNFPVGNTTVVFTATDRAGNKGSCEVTVSVVDVEPPVLSNCPSAVARDTDPGSAFGTVTGAAAVVARDNVGVASLTAQPSSVSVSGSSANYNGPYPIGDTQVSITATDAAGHTQSCTFTVTVTDREAPVLRCKQPQPFPNSPGMAEGRVEFGVQATDNSGAVPTVTYTLPGQSPKEGAHYEGVLAIGTHSVLFTATDPYGNSAECTVNVVVQDVEPPTFLDCYDRNFTTAPGLPFAVIEDFSLAAQDNSGKQPTVSPPVVSGEFQYGSRHLVFTARDTAGNVANCSIRITVLDKEPPVISVPSQELVYNLGRETATVVVIVATVTDNVAAPAEISVKHSLNGGPLRVGSIFLEELISGVHLVEFIAVDRDGNEARLTVTVRVEPPMDAVLLASPTFLDTCHNSFELSTLFSIIPDDAIVTLELAEHTSNVYSANYIKRVLQENQGARTITFNTGFVAPGEVENVVDAGTYTFLLVIRHGTRVKSANATVTVVAGDYTGTTYSVRLESSAFPPTVVTRDLEFDIDAIITPAGSCAPPLAYLEMQWTVTPPTFDLGPTAKKARLRVQPYLVDFNSEYTFHFTLRNAPDQPVLANASGSIVTGGRRRPILNKLVNYKIPEHGYHVDPRVKTVVTVGPGSRDPDYPDWSHVDLKWWCYAMEIDPNTQYYYKSMCLYTSSEGNFTWRDWIYDFYPNAPREWEIQEYYLVPVEKYTYKPQAPALTFNGRDFRPYVWYNHVLSMAGDGDWQNIDVRNVYRDHWFQAEPMGYVYFEMLVYCDINFFGWDDLWWRRMGREYDLPYCAWLNYTMPPEWLEPPYPLSSGFSTQSAQPVPVSFQWYEESGLIDLSGFTDSKLQLDPRVHYVPGEFYRICLRAKFSDGGEGKGCTAFRTLGASPVSSSPTPLVVAPSTGEAFRTKFELSLRGFTGINYFKFAYKVGDGEEMPLTSISSVNYAIAYLPPGDITIIGYVAGKETEAAKFTARLTVRAPANPGCALVSILEDALPSALRLGQEEVAVQLATYAAQLLGSVQRPVVCDGVDRTDVLDQAPANLSATVSALSNSGSLNSPASAVFYSAALEAVSSSAAGAISASSAFSVIDSILTGLEKGDWLGGERLAAAQNVMSVLSDMVGAGDCSVIAPAKQRIDRLRGLLMKGTGPMSAPVHISSQHIDLFVRRVSAFAPEADVSLPGTAFTVRVPNVALAATGGKHAGISVTRFSAAAVKTCRVGKKGASAGTVPGALTDITVSGEVLTDSILDVEVVNPDTNAAVSLSNLASPVVIFMPLARGCSENARCATWKDSQGSWIFAGVITEPGTNGVHCLATHLTEFALIGSTEACTSEGKLSSAATALIVIACALALAGVGFLVVRRTSVRSWVASFLTRKKLPSLPSPAQESPSAEVAASTA